MGYPIFFNQNSLKAATLLRKYTTITTQQSRSSTLLKHDIPNNIAFTQSTDIYKAVRTTNCVQISLKSRFYNDIYWAVTHCKD